MKKKIVLVFGLVITAVILVSLSGCTGTPEVNATQDQQQGISVSGEGC